MSEGEAITEKTEKKDAMAQAAAPKASVTNPEKVFWPNDGYTKGDLVEYYRAISKWMLPYLKDRPVMLTRWPDGIEGKMFLSEGCARIRAAMDSHRENIFRGLAARDFLFHPG